MSNFKDLVVFVGIIIFIFLSFLLFMYFSTFTKLSLEPSIWGAFGDYIGGLLNPLFGFLGFVGLLITINYQSKQLKQNRKTLKKTTTAIEQNERALKQNQKDLKLTRKELKNSNKQLELSAIAQTEIRRIQT